MNANELIAELEERHLQGCIYQEAATMLRQQQAELEALKLQLHTTLTNRDLRTYDGKLDMNNEPYIWMDDLGTTIGNEAYKELDDYLKDGLFPLYTHPAKTLTDEEIEEVAQALIDDCSYCSLHFARAILRKAQEK
jgi:hypothetical protein